MLKIGGGEIKDFFMKQDAESGVKAMIEIAEAMAEMVTETKDAKKGDKDQKPICGKLFFSEKHDWEAAKTFERELKNAKQTIRIQDKKLVFNGHDMSSIVKPLEDGLKSMDLEKVGFTFASELVKDEGSPKKPVPSKKDDKREMLFHAAHFAKGFLKGAKVGEFDIKELAECIEHEPETEKMMMIANKEVYESFKYKKPELGAKGLIEAAEAIVKMVKEVAHTSKDQVDQNSRPICAKLFFKKTNHW